jgi:hypothetical protein
VFQPINSPADTLTLDEVIGRLAQQKNVRGIVLIGSTADGSLTADSDYDQPLIFDFWHNLLSL